MSHLHHCWMIRGRFPGMRRWRQLGQRMPEQAGWLWRIDASRRQKRLGGAFLAERISEWVLVGRSDSFQIVLPSEKMSRWQQKKIDTSKRVWLYRKASWTLKTAKFGDVKEIERNDSNARILFEALLKYDPISFGFHHSRVIFQWTFEEPQRALISDPNSYNYVRWILEFSDFWQQGRRLGFFEIEQIIRKRILIRHGFYISLYMW